MKTMQRRLQIVLVTAALLVGTALPSAAWSQPQGGPIAELQQQVANLQNQVNAAISVPIGTVLDWWCPASCVLPTGFVIADGSVVTDLDSPLLGETLPNLLDTFVRGVITIGAIGTTGGSLNHSHAGTASAAGAHGHSASAGNSGSHTHTMGSAGNHSHSTGGPFGTRAVLTGFSSAASTSHTHNTSSAGAHTHAISGVTAHTHTISVGSVANHGHGITINTSDHTPSFVGLLKIIRIK